ncbi:PIG-L family deacetylase [Pigmentiphaga aceris]|uniref:PIG-L family deacetylase n=1 Tax=Pigmentiphaga aceris TaxID=1940612 RepID=A0A5C0AYD1_9BURK|nr:PIG-L family deacetylase [Pigmentiphaga aceris]QEI07469.1 PIG-L family deacetylase [Pigmentiphaga aceris]
MSRRIVGEGTSDADWAASQSLSGIAAAPLEALVPPGARAVIVAPHPDDEILGTGGLLRKLMAAGNPCLLIAVTDGGGSHPESSDWPVARLTATRRDETQEALRRLRVDCSGSPVEVLRLGLPDGGLRGQEDALTAALLAQLAPGDVVFATWDQDGHPDHEVVGRSAGRAAAQCGAALIQVPIWAWHWALPEDARMPWATARRLELNAADVAAKAHALQAFTSQITPDASTGRGPILPDWALTRMLRPFEVYFL